MPPAPPSTGPSTGSGGASGRSFDTLHYSGCGWHNNVQPALFDTLGYSGCGSSAINDLLKGGDAFERLRQVIVFCFERVSTHAQGVCGSDPRPLVVLKYL